MFDRKAKEIFLGTILMISIASLVSSCAQLKSIFPESGGNAASSNSTTKDSKKKGVVVWFVKANEEELELVPVKRSKTESDSLKSAIDQLLLGPNEEEGISSEIPAGTILLGIKEDGDRVILDLSRRFTSKGGSLSIQTRLSQLTKTVTDVAGDKKVYLDIEGERLTTLGEEGLEVKQPIN